MITKVFYVKNAKFRCNFNIFLKKNKEVNLKLSKLACWPKNAKGRVNRMELEGRRSSYVASFNINPTRLRMLAAKTPFGKYQVQTIIYEKLTFLMESYSYLNKFNPG